MFHVGLCPVCQQGVRGVRACGTRGVILCDECDAVWQRPTPVDAYTYPKQPLLPDPISGQSLIGPGTHWATAAEIDDYGWTAEIVGEIPREEPPAETAPLLVEVIGEPDATMPWVDTISQMSQLTLVGSREAKEAKERLAGVASDEADRPDIYVLPGRTNAVVETEQDAATMAASQYELITSALNAGSHVLARLPWHRSADDLRQLFDLAGEKGVCLQPLEGWWHHPRSHAMKALVDPSGIGHPQRLMIAHSVARHRLPFVKLLHRALLGTLWMLDRTAADVGEIAVMSKRDHGLVAMLSFPGTIATVDVSVTMPLRQWIEVAGENGSVVCDDLFTPPKSEPARFWIHAGMSNETKTFEAVDDDLACLSDFADLVERQAGAVCSLVLDAAELAERVLAEVDWNAAGETPHSVSS